MQRNEVHNPTTTKPCVTNIVVLSVLLVHREYSGSSFVLPRRPGSVDRHSYCRAKGDHVHSRNHVHSCNFNTPMICNSPAGIAPCNVRWQGSTKRQPGRTSTNQEDVFVLKLFSKFLYRMRLLELFSGTNSVGKIAEQLGYEIVSMDLKNADINTDILNWGYTTYPLQHFDVIWASPPCTQNITLANEILMKTLELAC